MKVSEKNSGALRAVWFLGDLRVRIFRRCVKNWRGPKLTLEHGLASVDRLVTQLLFYAEQLIVFGKPIGP